MKFLPRLVAWLIYCIYCPWCATLRITESGRERVDELDAKGDPVVFSLWHGEFFPMMHIRRQLRTGVLVSRSKDGDFAARVLERLGFATFRGSSSRGGAEALLRTAKDMRETGRHMCITLDGPRGPRHKAKDGAIFLAVTTPAWVVPVRALTPTAKVFASWDRFRLPLPFSRVHIAMGEPYRIEAESPTDEVRQAETVRLEERLEALGSAMPEADTLKYRFYKLPVRLMGALSLGATRRLARFGAFLFSLFARGRLREARRAVADRLSTSDAEARRISAASLAENLYSFLEIFHVAKFRTDTFVSLDAAPHNRAAIIAEPGPVVVATAHIGSWELMASLATDIFPERDRMVVVRKQRDPAVNRLMAELRGARGMSAVDHRLAASVVLPRLRRNGFVAFLVDHNCSRKEAVFLPFLGKIAAVNAGPAMIAVRARAVVYPAFMLRDGKGGHILHIHDPIRAAELTGSVAEKVEAIARHYTEAVERMVRQYPEQWFWMHKRWKTRPPEEGDE